MAKQKGASVENLDFTNVKDGGLFNKKHYVPGDYKGRITKVVDATKKDDKSVKMWLFTIEVKSGTYPYYCTRNAENQLWKIRNLFVAAGINVPKKRVAVDPNKLVGREIAVTLGDDEYDGKVNSVVESTFPLSELDEDEPEEAVEKPQGKKPKDKSPEVVDTPQGGKKDKGKKKGKKSKSDDVSAAELEELEIEDI